MRQRGIILWATKYFMSKTKLFLSLVDSELHFRSSFTILLFSIIFFSFPSLGISPEDQELYQRVKSKLRGQVDHIDRSIRRIGQKTVELETFISAEGDMRMSPQIFSDLSRFATWALPGINDRPSGGQYHVRILGLTPDRKNLSGLLVSMSLEFPLYHRKLDCLFKMDTEQKDGVFTLSGNFLPVQESIVTSAGGTLKVFPAENISNQVWVYIKGQVTLRHWLLYELMPIAVMARETGERIQIIMANYRTEEDRRLSEKKAMRVSAEKNSPN